MPAAPAAIPVATTIARARLERGGSRSSVLGTSSLPFLSFRFVALFRALKQCASITVTVVRGGCDALTSSGCRCDGETEPQDDEGPPEALAQVATDSCTPAAMPYARALFSRRAGDQVAEDRRILHRPTAGTTWCGPVRGPTETVRAHAGVKGQVVDLDERVHRGGSRPTCAGRRGGPRRGCPKE